MTISLYEEIRDEVLSLDAREGGKVTAVLGILAHNRVIRQQEIWAQADYGDNESREIFRNLRTYSSLGSNRFGIYKKRK